MNRAEKFLSVIAKINIPVILVFLIIIAPFTEWIDNHNVNRIKTFLWVIPLIIVLLMILSTYIIKKHRGYIYKILSDPENICVILLLFFLIASCFWNNFNNNLINFKVVIILISGLFYIFVTNLKFEVKHLHSFIKAFLAIGTFILIVGYFQIIISNYSFYKPFSTRLTSIFWDPNVFARFIVILDILCLSLLLFYKKYLSTIQKIFLGGIIFFSLMPLYLTYSRSGILLIMIGVSLVFYFIIKNKAFLIFLTVLSLVIGAFSMKKLQESERFKRDKKYAMDVSSLLRVFLIMGAVESIKENPMRGIGYDNFETVYKHKYQPSFARSITQKAKVTVLHNTMLSIWVEMGLGAVLTYLIWKILVIVKLVRYKTSNPLIQTFKVWALISFVLFFIFGMVYFSYLVEPIFWLIAYFTAIVQKLDNA